MFQPPVGGEPEHVLRLSCGLSDLGWDVDVAGSFHSPYGVRRRAVGLRVHELPFERYPGVADVRAARILRGLLRHGSYDVVHAHSSKAGRLVRLVMPSGQRAVYTPHCSRSRRARRLQRTPTRSSSSGPAPHAAVAAESQWESKQARHRLARVESVTNVIRNGFLPWFPPLLVPGCWSGPPGDGSRANWAGWTRRRVPSCSSGRLARVRGPRLQCLRALVGDGRLRDAVRSGGAPGLEARLRHEP